MAIFLSKANCQYNQLNIEKHVSSTLYIHLSLYRDYFAAECNRCVTFFHENEHFNGTRRELITNPIEIVLKTFKKFWFGAKMAQWTELS